jgi:ubiquinone biosynthesis protein
MLLALAKEDYDRLAYEYVDLAPFTDKVNVDLFAKDLREHIAPYYGLTLKNVNLGKLLMSSSGVAARHHLSLPTELMLFFKSIVAIEGLGRRIIPDFDFLQYSIEVANELVRHQLDPNKFMNEISMVLRESKNFIHALPRQANFLLRKINSPAHAFKLNVPQVDDLKRSIEVSFNLLFLGVIIAALILSASFIFIQPTENNISGMPTMSFIQYAMALVLGIVAFFNYIKK